jgi:hypothetical protein
MCGWSTTYKYLKIIWDDYKLVRNESRKDDLVDADSDGKKNRKRCCCLQIQNYSKLKLNTFINIIIGVADVLQISNQQLFTRKLKLAAKSCNPGLFGLFVAT